MVMLLGQYSTGKTTFIKHLLKCNYPGQSGFYISKAFHFYIVLIARNSLLVTNYFFIFSFFPGAHIGPEPTTDRFVVVMVWKCINLNYNFVFINLLLPNNCRRSGRRYDTKWAWKHMDLKSMKNNIGGHMTT